MAEQTQSAKEVTLRLTIGEASITQAALMTIRDSAPLTARPMLDELIDKVQEGIDRYV